MPLAKDTTFKVIGKEYLEKFLKTMGLDLDLDFGEFEEITEELVLLEGTIKKPDAIFAIGNVILMLEYQSKKLDIKDKKRFKVYVSVWDFKRNDDNKEIIFAVISGAVELPQLFLEVEDSYFTG